MYYFTNLNKANYPSEVFHYLSLSWMKTEKLKNCFRVSDEAEVSGLSLLGSRVLIKELNFETCITRTHLHRY